MSEIEKGAEKTPKTRKVKASTPVTTEEISTEKKEKKTRTKKNTETESGLLPFPTDNTKVEITQPLSEKEDTLDKEDNKRRRPRKSTNPEKISVEEAVLENHKPMTAKEKAEELFSEKNIEQAEKGLKDSLRKGIPQKERAEGRFVHRFNKPKENTPKRFVANNNNKQDRQELNY